MSDLLGADEEALLSQEIGTAADFLVRMADGLAATPPAPVDAKALQSTLARIPVVAMRLKARGRLSLRVQTEKTLDAINRTIAESLVPNLIRVLSARTPLPGGPPVDGGDPTALDVAETYLTITNWLIRQDSKHPAITWLKRGINPLTDQTRDYIDGAETSMESPDFPISVPSPPTCCASTSSAGFSSPPASRARPSRFSCEPASSRAPRFGARPWS